MPPTLERTFGVLNHLIEATGVPDHLVIGSSAVAVHCLARGLQSPDRIDDLDVVMGSDAARALIEAGGGSFKARSPHPAFRSSVLGTIMVDDGLSIDVTGDFAVRLPDGSWVPVNASKGVSHPDFPAVSIATREGLADMLRLFARPKDHARLALLEQG